VPAPRQRSRPLRTDQPLLRTTRRRHRFHDLLQRSVGRRDDLEHDFVGFDFDEHVVALRRFARLLVPGGDGAVRDRFRNVGAFISTVTRSSFFVFSMVAAAVARPVNDPDQP
jgi:hypothetical protein